LLLIASERSQYWGKRDTKLILPTNSSLSVTLDQDHLRSTTSSATSANFEKDRLWLNGEEEAIKAGSRIAVCIAALRGLREAEEAKDAKLEKVRPRGNVGPSRLRHWQGS
jgi:diphosphomevalonate decarboxylase